MRIVGLLTAAFLVLVGFGYRDGTQPDIERYREPKGYVCYHIATGLKIDGRLDDDVWQLAPWTDDFVDIEGETKARPRFRTRAKMLWDDKFFYVGAELVEPHVWATLTEHDSVIFQDNDFEVFIDPDGDNHEYYEFEMNALNTGWDLLLPRPYKDGGHAVNSWEIPGLKTAVHVRGTLNNPSDTDQNWTVEIAFPWKVLGELANRPSPPRDGDQWRVNFSRVEWRHEVVDGKYRKVPNTKEDNWVWSPQGVVDMHRPESWGSVQFSTATPGSVAFQPDRAGSVRHLLHCVYYAQTAYRKRHGRWARSLDELALPNLTDKSLTAPIRLETTSSGFEGIAETELRDGKPQRWHIRQDSKVWAE